MSSGDGEVKIDEVVTATMEGTDTASALASMVQLERSRAERLMRNLGRLSATFGITIIVALVIVCFVAYSVRPEIIVLGTLLGAFMIAVALSINTTYGFSRKHQLVVPGRMPTIDAWDSWFKMRSEDEILKSLPRVYLAITGLILICCSGSMVAGEVVLNPHNYNDVPYYISGWPHVFAACSVIYVISAILSLVLAFSIHKKYLKGIIICFMLVNIVGGFAAVQLNFASASGPRDVNMVDVNRMRSSNHGGMEKGQWITHDIELGIMLKFAAAEIALVLSFFNALLAVALAVDLLHKTGVVKSKFMGILGAVLIISAIAMELLIDIFCTSHVIRFARMLGINRSLFVISCLLTGLQALHGFHSAGNLRKFTVFVLSLALTVFTIMTMNSIFEFRSNGLTTEYVALSKCQGNSDSSLFCVYNTTGSHSDYKRDSKGVIYQTVSHYNTETYEETIEEKPLELACIPREKYCDGKADLFISYASARRRDGRLQLCGNFLDKTYWYIHRVDPLVPIDEVTCYSNTPLPWLIIAALTILFIDMVCAAILMFITHTSVPVAISAVFTTVKGLFGVRNNEEEETSKNENAEQTNTECTTTDNEPLCT